MMLPEILISETFKVMRERFINEFFIPHAIKSVGEVAANLMARGLRSPNETAALLLDAMILFRIQEVRNDNHKAKQFFSATVTDSAMVDLLVSHYGLKRQVIEEADLDAFPPKPAVMESDESLLLRYSLAPYGLSTTGTRTGYEFHALTIGERPLISVEAENPKLVVLRYEFRDSTGIKRPKSVKARMLEKNTGKVEVRILSWDNTGLADDELIKAVLDYITRPDIAQETDEITVKSAEILDYEINIKLKEVPEPNKLVDRDGLTKALIDYKNQQHKLEGEIKRSRLIQIAHNHNAEDVEILKPETDLSCEWYQAPFCTGINTSVEIR